MVPLWIINDTPYMTVQIMYSTEQWDGSWHKPVQLSG